MAADLNHEVHELPLANRIVDREIRDYITTACDTARAATGTTTPQEQAAQAAIDRLHHLDLAGWDHRLTPRILDALRRAGLLVAPDSRWSTGPDHPGGPPRSPRR